MFATVMSVTNIRKPGIGTKTPTTQAFPMIGKVAVQVLVNRNKRLAID